MHAIISIVNSLTRLKHIFNRAIALTTKNNARHTECIICTWVCSKMKPTYYLGTINQSESKQENVRKSKVHVSNHKLRLNLVQVLGLLLKGISLKSLN